jgi:hypothetical protein
MRVRCCRIWWHGIDDAPQEIWLFFAVRTMPAAPKNVE